MNSGSQVFLEVGHNLIGIQVGREIPGWIIPWMGVGHVARQHAIQTRRFHGSQSHRLTQQANLRVESNVNQVRQPLLLADGVDFSLRVRHQVALANRQRRMHAVPSVITRASLPAASAAAGIRNRRTGHIHHLRHRHRRQGKDSFTLGEPRIVFHHITRTQHDRHTQPPGRLQRLVDSRHKGVNPHRRCLAPVIVPHIHRNHPNALRIDFLLRQHDLARDRIAALQFKGQSVHHRRHKAHSQNKPS